MNALATYTHLMFLTLLVLLGLTGCSRSLDEDPIIFETHYVSSTENMTLDEWEMLKEKMIGQVAQRYSNRKSGQITVKPLTEESSAVTQQKAATQPQQSKGVITIPSTLKPNTLAQNKPQKPAANNKAKISRYSELKIKPSVVTPAKQYKIPPNSIKPKIVEKNTYTWPTKGTVTLKFGATSQGKQSKGIKIKTPANAPVLSIDKGKVIFVGSIKGMGKVILVEHPNSIIAAYAQVANITVTPNTEITKSQQIASVLNRSNSEGELHFEVRKGVKSIDPLSILP